MAHFDFDRIIPRQDTDCVKYDCAQDHGYSADVLPMWVADMDFQAPPCVLDALHKAVDHGIFGYHRTGCGYYAAVKNWFRTRFAWEVERDWIVQTPGVVFALSAAVRALTQPGDAVLVQPPVYYPFYKVIEGNDRRLVENPLIYENGAYRMDFADMEAKIRDHGVKMLILCSPHNPIGRVWTAEELGELGRICAKYDMAVISDEIHCDFAFPEYPHTPFVLACPELAERTVICTAPSKTFNLAGLQDSNIIIPGEALRAAFQKEMDTICYHGVNGLAAVACQAAYEQGGPWLDACKAYMRENLSYVRAYLAENIPQIKLVEPQGTYFAWLDCTSLGLIQEELDDLFLNKAKLWLDSGAIFGQCAAQFQRVVLACPRVIVEEAMSRLKNAVNEL